MAFQTGTASSFINLLDALRLFATANGWTQNLWADVGADKRLHLQKGSIYANFRAEADNTDLMLKGSLGFDAGAAWNAQPSTHPHTPRLRDGWYGAITWPVTYWFFLHTNPDSISVRIRYQPTRFFMIDIGAITKYGTWPGGEYYAASSEHATVGLDGSGAMGIQLPNQACNFPGLFWSKDDAFVYEAAPDLLHCEIDSHVWGTSARDTNAIPLATSASEHLYPLPQRSNNAFNGLTTLQPIELYALRPDNHWSPLGRIEHVRYAIVTNHNAGDIIDIGGQKWMLFPWVEKGGPTDAGGEHYGAAIKYDGP